MNQGRMKRSLSHTPTRLCLILSPLLRLYNVNITKRKSIAWKTSRVLKFNWIFLASFPENWVTWLCGERKKLRFASFYSTFMKLITPSQFRALFLLFNSPSPRQPIMLHRIMPLLLGMYIKITCDSSRKHWNDVLQNAVNYTRDKKSDEILVKIAIVKGQ